MERTIKPLQLKYELTDKFMLDVRRVPDHQAYDALYAWCRACPSEAAAWPPAMA